MKSLVVAHRVSMVFGYSLSDKVNPGIFGVRNKSGNPFLHVRTIGLIVPLHEHEWIIGNITKQLDAWLDTPVIIIFL